MIDYEKEFNRPDYALGSRQDSLATTFRLVYGWMAAGLALSGVIAWFTATSGLWRQVLMGPGYFGCIIAELVLVLVLSAAVHKLSPFAAVLMFVGYAALNGLTLSVVFIAYELASVTKVFFITAGMFGGLAVWGSVTKGDLSGIGSLCGMALWGIIIAAVVNIFMGSETLDFVISFVGILVFTGLTMYDAQKIRMLAASERSLDRDTLWRIGIIGALEIYLDFINLFLSILRLLGKRR